MKFLIKLFCLLSLVSSFAFSTEVFFFSTKDADNYLKKSNVKFLANNKYVMFDRPDDPGHVYVDRVYSYDTYFYAGSLRGYFWNNQTGDVYYISNDVKTNYFLDKGHWGTFTYAYEYSGTYNSNAVFLTYVSIYEFHKTNVAVCNVGEEFNTETMQCVHGCPAGQLWNVDTNSCVVDCSDEDNHKFFTSDYKCIDCSSALTKSEIAKCYCTGLGSSFNRSSFVFSSNSENPNLITTFCDNETEISFKFDKDKMKDKDNNSTNSSDKDKENPKPDKDKDNPNPDKKDNNENSNNSSGESGNPTNNNSGGSAGNGSSGGGGTGVETKPNPNYNGNGKEDGKGDGKEDSKGEEGKGDDAVAQKLDYGDLEKDSDKFNSDFKDALDSVISQAQDFKNSLNDTISKIKEGGLAKFNQSAIPNTCPLTYNVDFSYFRKDITFDICKVIAPASQTLYYFFYVVFFVLFLIVTIKLFLFTF
ncbi:hypothetical protein [Campylobacter concisus]|uniref:hypothetical protein n=1 Tax=Campylobacter concisus TaxID=199 RepID=UPI000CD95E4F|nr:hypothetical protein [Campylobacter concisus]